MSYSYLKNGKLKVSTIHNYIIFLKDLLSPQELLKLRLKDKCYKLQIYTRYWRHVLLLTLNINLSARDKFLSARKGTITD